MRLGRAVSGEANGRLRLSWGQIAWAIGVLVAILGSWADLRVNIAKIETRLDAQEARVNALEKARWGDAQAAPRPER